MRRTFASLAAGLAIAASGLVALAVPASAAPAAALATCNQTGANRDASTGHATEAAQIRSGPSTTCGAYAAQPSDLLDYYCWKEQAPSGSYTWTYLRDNRTGIKGWIRDDLLTGRGSTVHC